jgi:hypothetical protein
MLDLGESRSHLAAAAEELGVLPGHLRQQGSSRRVNKRDSTQINLDCAAIARLLLPAVAQDRNPWTSQFSFCLKSHVIANVMCGNSQHG